VGDAVLVEFARRLTDSVRASDTVARLAGDEFVVVFELVESYHGAGEAGEAGVLGQRIIDAMVPPFQIGALALPMTTSIGIALADIAHAQPAEVMQAADEALYRVKAQGRNGWLVHDLDKALSRPISRPAA